MAKEKEVGQGIIGQLVKDICDAYGLNEIEVKTRLVTKYPQLADKTKCANCEANMAVDRYNAGYGEATLLLTMAREVHKRCKAGAPFEAAQKVHIPTLDAPDQIRHAATRASYLDLIDQPGDMRNSGYWVITARGWAALRGAPIPKAAEYFRKRLVRRSDETTTIEEMFRTHVETARRAAANRREVETGVPELVERYSPREWTEFAGYAEGFAL
jgi:hypothetical protein